MSMIEKLLKNNKNMLLISIGAVVGFLLRSLTIEYHLMFNILLLIFLMSLVISLLDSEQLFRYFKKIKNFGARSSLKTEGTKYTGNEISQYIPSLILKRIQPRDLPKQKISIVGLGCAGINMIDFIVNESCRSFDTVVIDTDMQKLSHSKASYCLYLGNDREAVKKATNNQIEDIFKFIQKAKIIFLLTGLGGRTGEIITLQLTKYAIEKNKIVHVLAVTPFKEEGNVRNKNASVALRKIKDLANTVTAISNNDLNRVHGNNVKLVDSFNVIHEYWLKIVNGVYVKPGEHRLIISSHIEKIKNEGFNLQ